MVKYMQTEFSEEEYNEIWEARKTLRSNNWREFILELIRTKK